MEIKNLFNDELFLNLRTKEEQNKLKQIYFESGCNKDIYYLIISHLLLERYNCNEQIMLIKSFIKSDFNENLYMLIKSEVVNGKYDLSQIEELISIAKENEYDKDLMNIMRSSLYADYRTYDELKNAIKVYLNSKSQKIATIGILKKGYIVKNRTFNQQMMMAYLYESFLEYYYMYYLMSEKLMIENRSFEEQLLLTSAYLDTNGNRKVISIALREEYLKNKDSKYQFHKIANLFKLDECYNYLLDNQKELLNDKHICKVLRLDKYKRI